MEQKTKKILTTIVMKNDDLEHEIKCFKEGRVYSLCVVCKSKLQNSDIKNQ